MAGAVNISVRSVLKNLDKLPDLDSNIVVYYGSAQRGGMLLGGLRLLSEQGFDLRKKRSIEVETVFGDIKHNIGFRRFILRGMKKVEIEWGFDLHGLQFEKTGDPLTASLLSLACSHVLTPVFTRF